MMGVGKTTISRVIGERTGRRVVDSDLVIEARTGRTVREIFTTDGEPAFRALETEALLEALTEQEPLVIAAGRRRGAVRAATAPRQATSPSKVVLAVRADLATLVERVRSGAHRPLLDDDPAAVLQQMFTERAPLYRQVADAIVLVDNRSVADIVDAVLR